MKNNLIRKQIIMKTSAILLIAFITGSIILANESEGQALNEVSVSLEHKNIEVKKVFDILHKETNFNFLYRLKDVRSAGKVSLDKSKENLEELLYEISKQTGLSFKRVDDNIFVKLKEKQEGVVENAKTLFDKKITGKVTDAGTGEPLIGANIYIEGTNIGTVTDVNGAYSLYVPEDAEILIFSFVGYQKREVNIDNRSVIDMSLNSALQSLEEAVVTALGVKREEKALGYSQTNVDGDKLNEVKMGNWTEALTGKVAGLNITGAATGPNGSSKITLRGDNSLSAEGNDALIILDGIPIMSTTIGNGFNSYMGSNNAVDYGNRLSDINPDDVESVTVLKGPGASALYGSRAANGVLIITTKSGALKEKGIGITINSGVSFDDVLKWPDYQFEYGEGSNNADYYSYGDSEDGPDMIATASYGPKFDPNKMYFQYNPDAPDGMPTERTPWIGYPNTHKDFYETGITYSNSIAIEGGDSDNSARLSFGHIKNKWIIPFSEWQSYSASLSVNQKISEKLRVSGKANYTLKDNDNIPMSGYNNHSVAYNMLFRQPNYNNAWFPREDYWEEGMEDLLPKRIGDKLTGENPYLLAREVKNSSIRNSVTSSLTATYSFNDNLNLMVRSGVDMGNETRKERRPFNMKRLPEGSYREQHINLFEMNTDVLFTYKTFVTNNIGIVLNAGANTMHSKNQGLIAYADKLSMPGIYNLANSKDMPQSIPSYLEKKMNSLYSTINLSYDNKIFLDITGRNDWSSTLPQENNSYFYPSVNLSLALNDMFSLPGEIDFLKTRLSWAQVGNDARPYRTLKYYNPSDFPGSLENPRVLFNSELKPEITSSTEAGLDIRLLKSRIVLDLTVYKSKTENQILDIALSNESGYSNATVNSGVIQNKGIEVMFEAKPVRTTNFSWTTTLVWSANKNEVLELADGMDYQPIAEARGVAFIRATVGGSTGDIYGYKIQRAPDGQMIFRDGVPLLTETNNEYIGNAHPDWKGGITNALSYKNISFSFQFDGQMGGMVYSQTNHKLSQRGRLTKTLPGRDVGYVIGDGVMQNEDGTYSPNNVEVNPQRYYDQFYRRNNAETNTFDASFLKLREVSLSYELPRKLINRIGMKRAIVGVFGHDLLLFTDFPAFDPETAQLESNTISIGYESGQLPSTRTMGMNVKISF